MLYVAYGANINKNDMEKVRCRGANIYGEGYIKDYKLEFYSVATIEKSKGSNVPVIVWNINKEHERILDKFEGVRYGFYRKEIIKVCLDLGKEVEAMVYLLNTDNVSITAPNLDYFQTILQGYLANSLDAKYLYKALSRCTDSAEFNSYIEKVN